METYASLLALAINVIDPIYDHFGKLKITYGFASQRLMRHIKGRISPDLDQHASCELKQNGSLICNRRGAAVDFMVPKFGAIEVSKWIVDNCEFDRMYIYGNDRPIHISFGPDQSRQIILMLPHKDTQRRIPRILSEDRLRNLNPDDNIWPKFDPPH